MSAPTDPIAAVIHPDPYPYYAELVAQRPFYRDPQLGTWVATSAAAVDAVLNSPLCRVRPAAEPVPAAIRSGPAGTLFGSLVRQTDGAEHGALKPVIAMGMSALDPAQISRLAEEWAERLVDCFKPDQNRAGINDLTRHLPVCVVAGLLGFDSEAALRLVETTADLVGGFAPGASTERIAQGHRAAADLADAMRSNLAQPAKPDLLGLSDQRAQQAVQSSAVPPGLRIANAVGLLTQSYDATAGLIGNTLLALAAHGEFLQKTRTTPAALNGIVLEVLRHDAPVQNTRRFVAKTGQILGQPVQAGETILVVLAAANRDPRANSNPGRFDPGRNYRRIYTFGQGAHACPAKALAVGITQAGVAKLLDAGVDVQDAAAHFAYRPSANGRIPLFAPRVSAQSA